MNVSRDMIDDPAMLEFVAQRLGDELLELIKNDGCTPSGEVTCQLTEQFPIAHELPRTWWERLLRRKPRTYMPPPLWALRAEAKYFPLPDVTA